MLCWWNESSQQTSNRKSKSIEHILCWKFTRGDLQIIMRQQTTHRWSDTSSPGAGRMPRRRRRLASWCRYLACAFTSAADAEMLTDRLQTKQAFSSAENFPPPCNLAPTHQSTRASKRSRRHRLLLAHACVYLIKNAVLLVAFGQPPLVPAVGAGSHPHPPPARCSSRCPPE